MQCGSVFAGTILRFVQNAIMVAVVGYFLIRVVKGKTTPLILPPLIGLAVILFLVHLPGQIKKLDEVPGSGDIRAG